MDGTCLVCDIPYVPVPCPDGREACEMQHFGCPKCSGTMSTPVGGAKPRVLKATWTLEAAQDLLNTFNCVKELGPYDYIPRVRWWQFWRWSEAWSEDYLLSRAGDLVTARRMARELAEEMRLD